jgi:hypothetical protein
MNRLERKSNNEHEDGDLAVNVPYIPERVEAKTRPAFSKRQLAQSFQNI